MQDCLNYRCRRSIEDPDVIEIPAGWTSVVCPHCHYVLGLYARPRALNGFRRIPVLVEDAEFAGLAAAGSG